MSSDPAFLFFPNDYLGGTMGFTFEQHGAYITLLIYQFNNGPFKPEAGRQIVGGDLFDAIKHKFEPCDDGCICNARLMQEMCKRKSFSASRSENAKKRWEIDKNTMLVQSTCNASAMHMGDRNGNRNEDRINDKEEDSKEKKKKDSQLIYDAYPRKVGHKAAIEKIEKALKCMEFELLLKTVNDYAVSVKDKDPQYIPHPATWFNQERYRDPIQEPQQKLTARKEREKGQYQEEYKPLPRLL